ncbi:MAG TPA: ATP-binding protein [Candidatus Binatia bacterium]|nr:ATP-binding protein [Candidatus Binatia bacterium]
MTLHRLLPLVALGLNVLLLASALVGSRGSRRHYPFAALAAALAVWNFGVFGLRSTTSAETALEWERFLHVGVILIPVLFYHYVVAFLDESRRSRTLLVGYVLAAGFLVANGTSAFMRGVVDTTWGYAPLAGPLYPFFFVYFQAVVVLGLIKLLQAHGRLASSFRRNRVRLVIAGVAVSLLGGVIDFVRYVFGWEWLYPLGIPGNALFALALGLAVIRYRLFDLGMVARWTFVYALLGAVLAGGVVATLFLMDLVGPGGERLGLGHHAMFLVGAIAVAFPLLRLIERRLERVMFSRQRGVQEALIALSKQMTSMLDVEQLGRTLTAGLVQQVPLTHASLHLRTADRGFAAVAHALSPNAEASDEVTALDPRLALWLRLTGEPVAVGDLSGPRSAGDALTVVLEDLERRHVALVMPLVSDGELAAVLLVGAKLSGDIFLPTEVELLQMLMAQTEIALRNAQLYADQRDQMLELTRAQQQLVQSAKLAAIGELAASVAHEINNPLAVILGNCDLLLRGSPEGGAPHRRLTTMRAEAVRAGRITGGLLNFARRREPNREPIALHQLIQRAVDLLSAKTERESVRVELALDAAVPPVLGDGDQITQVLLNLGGNAVDAMPGGGTVIFRTALDAVADSVTLKVIDTGSGMTPEHAARIFQPFYTTKAEGLGTGLGMSVSLGIVKSHGGTLEVESEPGRGTTMIIRLPIATVSAGALPAVPA